MTSGRALKGYSEGMAFWTSVEGQLADGATLRLYVAAFRGRIWRVIMSDSRSPVLEDDAVHRFGAVDDWEPWPLGTGSGLLDAAAIQFEEYFSGRLLDFDLPLEFDGTAFQQTVWHALTNIPDGRLVAIATSLRLSANRRRRERWAARTAETICRSSFLAIV